MAGTFSLSEPTIDPPTDTLFPLPTGFMVCVVIPYLASFRVGMGRIVRLYRDQRNKRRIYALRIPKRYLDKDPTSGDFSVRAYPDNSSCTPLVCLVNPKSGGQVGVDPCACACGVRAQGLRTIGGPIWGPIGGPFGLAFTVFCLRLHPVQLPQPRRGKVQVGQGGYITPATWGVPTASERGPESEVAHKWARWLHNPCRLEGPHRFKAGGRIRSGPQVGKVAT